MKKDMKTTVNLLPDNWLRNTLLASGKTNFEEVYILPDLTKSEMAEIPIKKSKMTDDYIKLFPNPAKEYLVIDYKVCNTEISELVITDMMGKQVAKILLPKKVDQMIYDTSKLIAGAYNCSLFIGNKKKSTVTFSVIR